MATTEKANGQKVAKVHLLPELPKNAGALESCTEMNANDTYLLDGRVKTAKIGCGWKAESIDVDASLAVYDVDMKCVDVLWWDKKRSYYVSAKHLNDDRNGTALEGTNINEQMLVHFENVPPAVYHLLVVITVYSKGKSLKDVTNMMMNLTWDDAENKAHELLNFKARDFETSAAILGVFTRVGSWWKFTALGETASGRTVKEVAYSMTLDQIILEPAVLAKRFRIYAWAIEGTNLAASDRPYFGPRTSDCFVEIKYKGQRAVSEVIMKSVEPKWNMPKFELGEANESNNDVIEFNVWDHDTNSPDDFLGCAMVAVGGVCQKGEENFTLNLELGPSRDPNLKPKAHVEISGSIVVGFQVAIVDS